MAAPSTILSSRGVRYSVSSFKRPAPAKSMMVTGSSIAASGRSSVAPDNAVMVIFSRMSAVPSVWTNSIFTSGAISLWSSSHVSNHCCLYCGFPMAYTTRVPAGYTVFSPSAASAPSAVPLWPPWAFSALDAAVVPAWSVLPPQAAREPTTMDTASAIANFLFIILCSSF